MVKIKICGLTTSQDVVAVNQLQPELVGFVFADSFRQVTVEQARKLRLQLDQRILSVGVYVQPDLSQIKILAAEKIISMVQIHGPQRQNEVALIQSLGLQVIQVIQPGMRLETKPDFVMFDSLTPGSGHTVGWTAVPQPPQPFFLAGGLTADNVSQAIATVQPDFVDVSSGVETNRRKDYDKIKQFIVEVRNGKYSAK